jgi:YD repeat-containing protein
MIVPPRGDAVAGVRGAITPLQIAPPDSSSSNASLNAVSAANSTNSTASFRTGQAHSSNDRFVTFSEESGGSGGSPPAVTLSVPDATASEKGPDHATFRITRTGVTTGALTFTYSNVSGSAISGTDYDAFSGSLVIPASMSFAEFDLVPIADNISEATEDVGVAITPNPGVYTISGSGQTANILDNNPNSGSTSGNNDGASSNSGATCPPDTAVQPDSGIATIAADANGQPFCGASRPTNVTDANPHPIVSADWTIPIGLALPDRVEATLYISTVTSSTVYYSVSTRTPGDTVHLALQVDASSLPTGHYNTFIEVDSFRSGVQTTEYIPGKIEINNLITSPYGNRWWLNDVDRIVPVTAGVSLGVALIRGDRTTAWFADSGVANQYITPDGSTTKLTGSTSTGWLLTYNDGSKDTFNGDVAGGMLINRTNYNGRLTTYTYTDADGDSKVRELSQKTNPDGQTAYYNYGATYTSGGVSRYNLTSMTDFFGRTTTYAYSNSSANLLVSQTQVDPDGSGPLSSSVTSFNYDATTKLLTSETDPTSRTTTYYYSFAQRVSSVLSSDGGTTTISPAELVGLFNLSLGPGSSTLSLATLPLSTDVHSTITDPYSGATTMTFDRFGNAVKSIDAMGHVTTYDRDSDGRVTKLTKPDPDGSGGPLAAPESLYNYDSKGNLTSMTLPDGSSRAWTYDATTNQALTYRDENNHTTTYTLDSHGNPLTAVDPLGRTTSYTYYTAGNAAGLLKTVTQPSADGVLATPVTTYAYDANNRLATHHLPRQHDDTLQLRLREQSQKDGR